MAGKHKRSCISVFSHSIFSMALTGIIQLILVVSVLAERCTRAVPIQKQAPQKMHVLRRLPAACSNWDKAWTWLTKTDCGTKYRLDYVTVPSNKVQYKLKFVCCDGDTDCKDAENIHSSGFDSTDERFLAIVLGSTAAAVIIIIVIIAISLCTRKRRCLSARENGHSYDRAEDEDKDGENATEEKCCHEERASDEDCKGTEPVYAEIGDSTLPRYTDLFKTTTTTTKGSTSEDPFKHATAPPVASKSCLKASAIHSTPLCTQTYTNTTIDGAAANGATTCARVTPNGTVVGEDKNTSLSKPGQTVQQVDSNGEITETRYYNVREKKKKKKRNSRPIKDQQRERAERDSVIEEGGTTATPPYAAAGGGGGKPRSSVPVTVEMMVRSASTSDSMTGAKSKRETSLSQQKKRRSAPPDSPDLRIPGGEISSSHAQTSSSKSHKTTPVDTCDVTSVCTVHQKPHPSPITHFNSKDSNEERNTNAVTNAKRGKGGGGGEGGERGAGRVGREGVQKSSSSTGAAIKSPPQLESPSSSNNNRRQSYENIPQLCVVVNSNNYIENKIPKKKSKTEEIGGRGGPITHSHPHSVRSMHAQTKKANSHLNANASASLSDSPHPPHLHKTDNNVDSNIPQQEVDSAGSPLLPSPAEIAANPISSPCQDSDLDLSCASPLLNEHSSSYLASVPFSRSEVSSDVARSPSTDACGGSTSVYDTLQYSANPSIDEEHLYQKLQGLDPTPLAKC